MKSIYLCLPLSIFLLCSCDFHKSSPEDLTAKSVGRYQLVQLGQMRRDQFLIDTATGRVWNNVCEYNSKPHDGSNCDINVYREITVIKTKEDSDRVSKEAYLLENMNKNNNKKNSR
jgi:hypothetical protein